MRCLVPNVETMERRKSLPKERQTWVEVCSNRFWMKIRSLPSHTELKENVRFNLSKKIEYDLKFLTKITIQVVGVDLETKQASSLWKTAIFPIPKNTRQCGLFFFFFWFLWNKSSGIYPLGQSLNQYFYLKFFSHLREDMRR